MSEIYEGPAGAAPNQRDSPSASDILQNMRKQNQHVDDALYYAKKHGPYSGKDQGKDGMDYEIFKDSEGKQFSFLKTPRGMIHVTGHLTWQPDKKGGK